MRILHVVTGLRRDGAQRTLLGLARDLSARGIASRVVALGPREGIAEDLEAAGIPVTCLDLAFLLRSPAGWPAGLRRLAGVWRIARAGREDVFAGWLYHGNLAATLLSGCAGRRAPVVWNIRHSLDDPRGDKRLTRALIRLGALGTACSSGHPARIVYNSHRSAAQHAARGYRATHAIVIGNGVDVSLFAPPAPEARAARRSRFPGPPDAVWIGMVARPHPVKDHAGLVAAAARLRPRFPAARFLLLGRDLDAPDHPVRGLVRAAGLEDIFFCPGEAKDVAEVAAWMGACDLAVSASRGEGFPGAVLEAMACGVPVVATDVGDTARLVGDAGIIVPPGDPRALAEALAQALAAGATWRRARGAAARARAVSLFARKRMTDGYENLLRAVAAAENSEGAGA